MSTDLDKICTTLDKLTLDALTLMEEEIRLKIHIEDAMCGGETHLAKARYILGQTSVSSIQLPSENSQNLEASAVIKSVEDDSHFDHRKMELNVVKRENHVNPVRWFGYLVPQDLYHSQILFRQALQWVVSAANTQKRFVETCIKIHQLKELKKTA